MEDELLSEFLIIFSEWYVDGILDCVEQRIKWIFTQKGY